MNIQFTPSQLKVLLFSLTYTLGFGAYYVTTANYEFLWYVAILVFFLVLLLTTIHKTHFSPLILWGLSIWGLLHMAGGSIPVGDGVLYGVQLIDIIQNGEYTILRYDQFVHAFGFGVATLVAHSLLAPRWKEGSSKALLYALAAGVGMGLGTINEIVEFIAVVVFPETGVGGYVNTALDLVANMIGAIIAALFLSWRDKQR